MLSQKQAVCNVILSVYKERTGVDYELQSETPINNLLSNEDKAAIKAIILAGFMSNTISMSEQAQGKYSDETKMKGYVSGLVNNWITKSPDFNGGNKYEPKNKGSRTGQGDETVRALRSLLKITTDPEVQAEIQEALQARLIVIKPASVISINVDALPEHLRHLVK